jgi:pSer/pThr/pTyr-binding forkhead associated (FHA) protein
MPKVIINYFKGKKAADSVIYDISETTIISFGVSESSTVVLDKTNDSFARHHCSIIYQGNNFYLRDEAPRRQTLTFINNDKLELTQKLYAEDRIRLGRKHSIEFTVDFDPRPDSRSLAMPSDDKLSWLNNVIKFIFG